MLSRYSILVAAAAGALISSPSRASISDYGVQKTNSYTQAADNSASYTNSSISAFVDVTDAADSTFFTLSSTGNFGTSISLLGSAPGRATGGGTYASTADLDAAFPASKAYEIMANNGTQGGQGAGILSTTTDAFPKALVLTGTSFSGAQNLNAEASYDFTFAPLGGGSNDGSSSVGLTIFDSTNNVVYSSTTTTGDFFIPSGILSDSTTYSAQLANFDITDAVDTSVMSVYTGARTSDGFASITSFSISTASAPEPGTWLLLGAGVIALGLLRRSGLLGSR